MASIEELRKVELTGPWVMLIDGPASLPSRTQGERDELERTADFLIQNDAVRQIAIVRVEDIGAAR